MATSEKLFNRNESRHLSIFPHPGGLHQSPDS